MRYDVHFLFTLVAIGLIFRKIGWKGWFGVSLLILGWMALNLWKGLYS